MSTTKTTQEYKVETTDLNTDETTVDIFDSREEASDFASTHYTCMDTQEARNTLIRRTRADNAPTTMVPIR